MIPTNIRTLIFIACLLSISCSKNKETAHVIDSNKNLTSICERTINYGGTDICIPEIDGMIECLNNPSIKSRTSQIEMYGTINLGYYLNEKTFKNIESLKDMGFDDYIKVWGSEKISTVKVSKSEFLEWSKSEILSNSKEIFDEIENHSKIKDRFGSLEIGQPLILETYNLNENSATSISLLKLQTETAEIILVAGTNWLLIDEKIFWVAYYKYYESKETIQKTKAKNDYIVLSFLNQNK
jgi:hypothetical protein